MSGKTKKSPRDANAFRKAYLANLNLTIANNDKNYQANKLHRRTGVVATTQSDYRSTSEKLADITGLRILVRKHLRQIADSTNADAISQQLSADQLVFVAQNIDALVKLVKPKFKYGVQPAIFIPIVDKVIREERAGAVGGAIGGGGGGGAPIALVEPADEDPAGYDLYAGGMERGKPLGSDELPLLEDIMANLRLNNKVDKKVEIKLEEQYGAIRHIIEELPKFSLIQDPDDMEQAKNAYAEIQRHLPNTRELADILSRLEENGDDELRVNDICDDFYQKIFVSPEFEKAMRTLMRLINKAKREQKLAGGEYSSKTFDFTGIFEGLPEKFGAKAQEEAEEFGGQAEVEARAEAEVEAGGWGEEKSELSQQQRRQNEIAKNLASKKGIPFEFPEQESFDAVGVIKDKPYRKAELERLIKEGSFFESSTGYDQESNELMRNLMTYVDDQSFSINYSNYKEQLYNIRSVGYGKKKQVDVLRRKIVPDLARIYLSHLDEIKSMYKKQEAEKSASGLEEGEIEEETGGYGGGGGGGAGGLNIANRIGAPPSISHSGESMGGVTSQETIGSESPKSPKPRPAPKGLFSKVIALESPAPKVVTSKPTIKVKPPPPSNTPPKEKKEEKQPKTGVGLRKIKGKGIHIDTDLGVADKLKFAQFGRYVINTYKLNDDIVCLAKATGANVSNLKTQRVSLPVANVIRKMVNGDRPSFNDLKSLKEEDKVVLDEIVKKCQINGGDLDLPEPSNNREDLNQFEIMKGELLSGNDSKDLVKKFKLLIMKLGHLGRLPKGQVKELLYELAQLGY